MSDFPYAERFTVNRNLPEAGRDRKEVLDELRQIAEEEDSTWETGSPTSTPVVASRSDSVAVLVGESGEAINRTRAGGLTADSVVTPQPSHCRAMLAVLPASTRSSLSSNPAGQATLASPLMREPAARSETTWMRGAVGSVWSAALSS